MTFDGLNTPETVTSKCHFGRWYKTIDDADRKLLINAFADETLTSSFIYRVITKNGYPNSESTLRTHRKNLCKSCGPYLLS